jgi:hypothetical protein
VQGKGKLTIATGGIFTDKDSQETIQAMFASISSRLKLKPYSASGIETFENPAQRLVIKKT